MTIFSEIRDAIVGYPGQPQQHEQAQRRAMAQLDRSDPQRQARVDVEAVLTELHRDKSEPDLHWRTSVADLMTLLDLDASRDRREALAQELGYSGTFDDSAEMNRWLYRRIMQELEATGARVPGSLAH
jgi:hypothetical protein